MIVENKLTPLTRDDAARALLAAYRELTGMLPSTAVLALLLAQSAFETGHWKSLHNFNFGNAKAGPGYPTIVQFRCSEVDEHGVEHFYDPPDPHCNFRAYPDATAGALDYLKVLRARPHWWQGLHTADPSAFVDALATAPKYFTGNVSVYKRSVISLFKSFFPLAEVALAVAAALPSAPVRPVVPAPPSSSASSPPASSGAPSEPRKSDDSSVGKATAPGPAAPSAPTASDNAPLVPDCAERKVSFWQLLIDFFRGFIAPFLRSRPRRPPGGSRDL
jgi:hypothetical protein